MCSHKTKANDSKIVMVKKLKKKWKKGNSDNIFKLLENILQMEIGIIEIKFVCCYSDNNQKRTDRQFESVVLYSTLHEIR